MTKELTIADRKHQLFEGLSHWNSFIRKATQVEFPPVMSSEDPVLSSSLSPRGPCIDNDSACRTWVKPCSQDICLGVENLKWAPYRVHTNFLRANYFFHSFFWKLFFIFCQTHTVKSETKIDCNLHLEKSQNLKMAKKWHILWRLSVLNNIPYFFPNLNLVFHIFSRSGKLVYRFPYFLKIHRLCTTPEFFRIIRVRELLIRKNHPLN